MAELLIELFSEEIPARMQNGAADDLRRLVLDRLGKAGLTGTGAEAFATPRRLALAVEGVPLRQADVAEDRRGPREDAPDAAIRGFLKSAGLARVEDAEIRDTEKGRFLFASRVVKGRASREVLPDLVADAVRALVWPKSMRWGGGDFAWVRPLQSILAVFDGEPLAGGLDLGGRTLPFGDKTRGHRFLAPEPFPVAGLAGYGRALHRAFVMLDGAERRTYIARQAAATAKRARLGVRDDPGLLDEVAGLVEWPVVLMGRIDDVFMDLPPEVLTSAMRAHQRYFALQHRDGTLANRFVVVANMETRDGGRAIVTGNERVLRARLSDAKFFWDQDRKIRLGARATRLKAVVFHARLGSFDDKADRVQALAAEIALHVPGADIDRVRSAARLAKCDLVTGMVGEFPDLQGVMGRYYALHDGEHDDVAQAIADHYAPQGPADRCPSAPISVALALADKIDTLAGFFAIGEKPTGSKDPYALRRAALGIIRLILENGLRLPLRRIFGAARPDAPVDDLMAFVADRLKISLREKGVRHDLITAVFALDGEDDLVRLLARVEALTAFLTGEDGRNLLVAYRRAANIVRAEAKKDGGPGGPVDEALLAPGPEQDLAAALANALAPTRAALTAENYGRAMAQLAALRRPLDVFFERVTVNADDPALRRNRLALMARIGAVVNEVADFSRIEG